MNKTKINQEFLRKCLKILSEVFENKFKDRFYNDTIKV